MLFRNISIIDENFCVRSDMFVKVDEGKISYIGEKDPGTTGTRVYDGRGKLLMSGFFNAHAHSPMTLLRGYAENMNLQDWLFTRIFPYEAHLTGERVYAATMLAMAESLAMGIVSTSDMYFFSEDMVRAYMDCGVKANVSRAISIMDDTDVEDSPAGREAISLFRTYDGAAKGRVKVDMSLHAEYTNTEKSAVQLAELTNKLGSGMHVHVSETRREVSECIERHGKTPVRFLADAGIFDRRTTAAHCVHLEEEDYDILKEHGVFVAVNPVSNLKLASGVCDVPGLLDRDINVAIGTDGVSSNDCLDMMEEMKIFAIAPKMYYNAPSQITTAEVIRAATWTGAKSQGRSDTGLLKEGNKADLIVVDISGVHMRPRHSLLSNLVYSASGRDVLLTMIDGNVLYENGEYKTIDIEKIIYEVEKSNRDILAEIQEQEN